MRGVRNRFGQRIVTDRERRTASASLPVLCSPPPSPSKSPLLSATKSPLALSTPKAPVGAGLLPPLRDGGPSSPILRPVAQRMGETKGERKDTAESAVAEESIWYWLGSCSLSFSLPRLIFPWAILLIPRWFFRVHFQGCRSLEITGGARVACDETEVLRRAVSAHAANRRRYTVRSTDHGLHPQVRTCVPLSRPFFISLVSMVLTCVAVK